MARVSINGRNRYQHGIVRHNQTLQNSGELDVAKIAERGMRAVHVVGEYSIFALGSKRNGWGEAVEAYEVEKPGGRTYEVQMRVSGQGSCTCPDWINRRHVHAGLCKHVIAVKALRQGRVG